MDGEESELKSIFIKWVIVCVVIVMPLIILFLVITKTGNKKNEGFIGGSATCSDMTTKYPTTNGNITSIDVNNADNQQRLSNYYVKSSYNSCCLGNFSNDEVGLCALTNVIKDGCRCLDLEIYSIDGRPVVSASVDPKDFYMKDAPNHLPFKDVMETIGKNAFSTGANDGGAPNPNDPLFINIRIKTKNTNIYDEIKRVINDSYLAGRIYQLGEGQHMNDQLLHTLAGKVVIFMNDPNNVWASKGIKATTDDKTQYFKVSSNYDVMYAPDANNLIELNKQNLMLSIPDAGKFAYNMNYEAHAKYGVQFICMNMQTDDDNLKTMRKKFDVAKSAFILKPPNLRFIPNVVSAPKPQTPAVSFAPKTTSINGIQISM